MKLRLSTHLPAAQAARYFSLRDGYPTTTWVHAGVKNCVSWVTPPSSSIACRKPAFSFSLNADSKNAFGCAATLDTSVAVIVAVPPGVWVARAPSCDGAPAPPRSAATPPGTGLPRRQPTVMSWRGGLGPVVPVSACECPLWLQRRPVGCPAMRETRSRCGCILHCFVHKHGGRSFRGRPRRPLGL